MIRLERGPKALRLPLEVATEAMGILATRGAGKSYASAVMIEELHDNDIQVVVLDPAGVYWGLTSSADGEKAGLPFYVFGGEHGDLPLELHAGAKYADLVVDSGHSFVFDFTDFPTKADITRFVTAFAERLYYRKGTARTPLHLVIDEADEFAPQKPMRDETRMLSNVERLVKRGRSRGIGVTLITQRSQAINKSVLDLIETLVVMRMLSPRSVDAVKAWITAKDLRDELGVTESLPGLATGTAWIWSPLRGILQEVKVRRIRTFDSYATPKPGEVRTEPSKRAALDLDALGEKMRASVEKAKENDPGEQRRRVTQLEHELARAVAAANDREHLLERIDVLERELAERPIEPERVEVPAISDEVLLELVTAVNQIRMATNPIAEALQKVTDGKVRPAQSADEPSRPRSAKRVPAPPQRRTGRTASEPPRATSNGDDVKLKAGARRMVTMLATMHPEAISRVQLGTLSDITPTSGTFSDYINALKRAGLVEEADGVVWLTDTGVAEAGDAVHRSPPSPSELQQMWGRKFKAGARRMLDELMRAYPNGLTRDELAERVEITRTSGTFSDYINALKRNKVAVEDGGVVKAGEALFLGQ